MMTRSEKAKRHSVHSAHCTCGRVVYGNGGKSGHSYMHEQKSDGHHFVSPTKYHQMFPDGDPKRKPKEPKAPRKPEIPMNAEIEGPIVASLCAKDWAISGDILNGEEVVAYYLEIKHGVVDPEFVLGRLTYSEEMFRRRRDRARQALRQAGLIRLVKRSRRWESVLKPGGEPR